jgi:hypothetical protein
MSPNPDDFDDASPADAPDGPDGLDGPDGSNGPSGSAGPDGPRASRRRLLGAFGAAATAGLAGCNASLIDVRREHRTVERRFDATGLARLRVVDADDAVTVRPGADGGAVRVRVRKRSVGETTPEELRLTSRRDGDALTLGTEVPSVVGVGGGSVDLTLYVPESVAVDRVGTADGDVTVRAVDGDPHVTTTDGDVAVSDVAGDVRAESVDGDVVVERTDGTVTAVSTDGSVTVREPGRVATVRTTDGDVVADVPAVAGDASVGSNDGDVTVRLGASLDAAVDARTDDGRVTVAGGLDTVETATDTRVGGVAGDGTRRLAIRTHDGDVTVTGVGE